MARFGGIGKAVKNTANRARMTASGARKGVMKLRDRAGKFAYQGKVKARAGRINKIRKTNATRKLNQAKNISGKMKLNYLVNAKSPGALLVTRKAKINKLAGRAAVIGVSAINKASSAIKSAKAFGTGAARVIKSSPTKVSRFVRRNKVKTALGAATLGIGGVLASRSLGSNGQSTRSERGRFQ